VGMMFVLSLCCYLAVYVSDILIHTRYIILVLLILLTVFIHGMHACIYDVNTAHVYMYMYILVDFSQDPTG
jgi:hypothetical protein